MVKVARKRPPPVPKVPKRVTPADAIPRVIRNPSTNDHLEIITRAIFQAGLSWAMIDARWDTFSKEFESFNALALSMYGEYELERLMAADNIIHSAKKIAATFANARTLIALEREFGSIGQYVTTFPTYDTLYADAHSRFAFMGDLNCYYWLFRTANPVPLFEDWIAGQDRDHPRMREVVLHARSTGFSSERPGF